jgi:hypothetical protein
VNSKVDVATRDSAVSGESVVEQWREWRDAPLSGWKCFRGWCLASALFFGFTHSLGGPSAVDATESIYATWAIEHGQFACAFPSVAVRELPEIVPVYPLISGAVASVLRVVDGLPYPVRDSQPAACNSQYPRVVGWATRTSALIPTLDIGYVAWKGSTG